MTIVPRGGARVLLVAGAVAVAALVALSAWLLRPAGESSPTGNGWVPGAGSVEWMRIERARPATTPLADLNSLDPGALPVTNPRAAEPRGPMPLAPTMIT